METVGLGAPFEIVDLAVGRMFGVETTEFETHVRATGGSMNPSRGIPFLKDVSDWREIDEVDATGIGLHFPIMRVTKDVSFNLFSGTDNVEEGFGIFQAADIFVHARIMMDHHGGGLVAISIQRFGQPIQLFLPQEARR